MKRLMILLTVVFIFGCEPGSEHPEGWPHKATRPADIPSHNCSGRETYWDWKHQKAYNEGRLTVHYNDKGCMIAISIKLK